MSRYGDQQYGGFGYSGGSGRGGAVRPGSTYSSGQYGSYDTGRNDGLGAWGDASEPVARDDGDGWGAGGGGSGASGGSGGGDPWTHHHDRMFSAVQQLAEVLPQLQRMIQKVGTSEDSTQLRGRIQSKMADVKKLTENVSTAMKQLQTMQDSGANAKENSKRKRVLSRLTQDFQNLMDRLKPLAKEWLRKQKTPAPRRDGGAIGSEHYYQQPPEDQSRSPLLGAPSGAHAFNHSQQQLAAIDAQMEFHEYLVEENDEQIAEVEASVNEVAQLFHEFGATVQEQQVFIDSIDNNIETAVVETTKAVQELNKAQGHQKSANKKVWYIAAFCLIIFGLIVAIVVLGITFRML